MQGVLDLRERKWHPREQLAAPHIGADSWAMVASPSRSASKIGKKNSNCGKISRTIVKVGPLPLGPTIVPSSTRDSGKRDIAHMSEPNSSQNMFSMLASEASG